MARQTALSDGISEPIKLELAMTVKDDSIEIDFAGTAPQVAKAINVCMAYTIAYTSFGVKAVLSPHIPNNEGVLKPITIKAPAGSIANSTPPAAGGARALIGHFFPMMVIQALSQALSLYLQAFDNQPGISIPFASLDYSRVSAWLKAALLLDAAAQYPLMMASHLYGQVPEESKQRAMCEFVQQRFIENPNARWRWLALLPVPKTLC